MIAQAAQQIAATSGVPISYLISAITALAGVIGLLWRLDRAALTARIDELKAAAATEASARTEANRLILTLTEQGAEARARVVALEERLNDYEEG